MGNAYFDKKDYYNAITNIEKAIKINPNLGEEVISIIKELKNNVDKLQESLSLLFLEKK